MGARTEPDESLRGKVDDTFTLNSPVGIARDKNNRIRVCDTGNNRVLIFDFRFSPSSCPDCVKDFYPMFSKE